MSKTQLRAIVGARVSVFTDAKVSHTAQIEAATRWAKSNGAKVVGSFQDLGTSASVEPKQREELGKWLTLEGLEQWDAIVFSRLDRAFRSIRHCVDFAKDMEQHQKMLVFAEDNLTLDYRPGVAKDRMDSMMAELFVVLGSFFAQVELARFRERALDRHSQIRQTDRWASGVPPLGYRTIDHSSGQGKALEIDPDTNELLHEMSRKLIDGWSFIRIAAWLNTQGIRTNMDRARMAKGKAPYANPWNVGTVIDALTSPRTQGLKMSRGQVVLDAEGEPIRLAPPTFEAGTWKQLQAAAQQRRMNQRTPTKNVNPMLGVGVCGCPGCDACMNKLSEGICGNALALQVSRKKTKEGDIGEPVVYRSYRCGRTPLNCNGVSMRAADAEHFLTETFLEMFGAEKVTKRVFVAGEDHSYELEQVRETITRLRRDRATPGLLTTNEDEAEWLQQMQALVARRDALQAKPLRAAGWIDEELDNTYDDAWQEQSDDDGLTAYHRQLLIDKGISFVLHRESYGLRPEMRVPWQPGAPTVDLEELNREAEARRPKVDEARIREARQKR